MKFACSPSLIKPVPKNYGDIPAIQERWKDSGFPLIISFSGLGGEFNFENTLSGLDVNVLYIRDLKHHWYLNGIKGITKDVEGTKQWLQAFIAERKPRQVITVGASAGGFAALLYGALLNANNIVAFSPQSFMDRQHCLRYFDYRWLDRVVEINLDQPKNQFLDLVPVVAHSTQPIYIYYDIAHRLDRIHAARLRSPQLIHHPRNGGGHELVKQLRDSGQLSQLFNSLIGKSS